MNRQEKKENKVTGAGEIGGPRPGVGGMQRVLSASLSDDHKGEQVEDQAAPPRVILERGIQGRQGRSRETIISNTEELGPSVENA